MTRSSDEWVGLTDHAGDQWRERADPPESIGPRIAWFDGVVVHEPHGLEADEVRYHPPSGVVLLRKDGDLVTVIDVGPDAKPELRQAVRRLGDVADLEAGDVA